MNKILTIVIPSYNTEEYMDFCLPFFLSDDKILSSIELLIVNDGSIDKTLQKAITYAEKYPDTIKIIDKKNGGHGSTINIGVKEAKGKYIKVVDGDDWVISKNLTKLVKFLETVDYDMVINPYIEYNEKNSKEKIKKNRFIEKYKFACSYNFDDIDFENEWIQMHSITYRTEVLQDNELILDENTFYVDAEYILYPIPYIKKICFLDFPVYMYRVNSDQQSVSLQGIQKNINHHRKVVDSCLDFFYDIENELSKTKRKYIEYRIIRLINTQYNIFFSFAPTEIKMKELEEFDLYIQEKHKHFYVSSKDNIFVKIYKKNSNTYRIIYYMNKIRLKFKFL